MPGKSSYIIYKNFPLKAYNTFGIEVFAKRFVLFDTVEKVLQTIRDGLFLGHDFLILGGGSNILFTKNFDGIVIKNEISGITIVEETDAHIFLKSGSGEVWHNVVLHCVGNNWGGIENLSLIPGTVGAAPIQNIGAYGVELKDTLYHVEAINLETGAIRTFSNEECSFGYRNSIFKSELKNKYFITAITLELKKDPELNTSYGAIQQTLEKNNIRELSVKTISDAVIEIRKSKLPDPSVLGNAGSFFKNPEIETSHFEMLKKDFPFMPGYPSKEKIKVPAGWLIEQCGWKGKRLGNTGAHKDQALVLVNYGGATGQEIYDLAMKIKDSVKEKFSIDITPEVNIL